jgi:predicted Fe-Mo cluster-binding NifX family protein
VLIAIPVLQERISPVLDTAARLLLITRRRGKEVARREFVLGPLPPEGLARSVAELRVDVLLCAALSEPLLRALERRGVRVKPHLCGEVESVLRAFDCGQLRRDEFRMPGCGDNICTADVAAAGTLRGTTSPTGKKSMPKHRHENITLKTIASGKARGPQRQTSLIPNHRVARLETRATGHARVWQC